MLGPKRVRLSGGEPVPRSVTRKLRDGVFCAPIAGPRARMTRTATSARYGRGMGISLGFLATARANQQVGDRPRRSAQIRKYISSRWCWVRRMASTSLHGYPAMLRAANVAGEVIAQYSLS